MNFVSQPIETYSQKSQEFRSESFFENNGVSLYSVFKIIIQYTVSFTLVSHLTNKVA